MKLYQLNNMTKGWFVGDFEPSVLRTKHVEVAVKYYSKGDAETSHLHKIADEVTLVLKGEVSMNRTRYYEGDIIHIEPGESTDFVAITDSATVVVKIPSCTNDKYHNLESE